MNTPTDPYPTVRQRVDAITWPPTGLRQADFERLAFQFNVPTDEMDGLLKRLVEDRVIWRVTIDDEPRILPGHLLPIKHGRPNLKALGLIDEAKRTASRTAAWAIKEIAYAASMILSFAENAENGDYADQREAAWHHRRLHDDIRSVAKRAIRTCSLLDLQESVDRLYPMTSAQLFVVVPWLEKGQEAPDWLSGREVAPTRQPKLYGREKALAVIAKAGPTGISKTDLHRAIDSASKANAAHVVGELLKAGEIVELGRKSGLRGGRPVTYYGLPVAEEDDRWAFTG